ncbi:cilia- and flagella-associated protein 298-like [Physella acuta]|uniref:cilia- and flagella-associated protein 298-like n=1 Tax=Physella acuta TaxID=109671 RepID=UPI0027DC5899|nr:cilia- and flagella-associated protein 298-like [Physella acuta]XP_059171439.1 cilia- and flagella-associated protein 298-like [Physella acuta]XP_059171440.1 cilia- and flagella-associated protein 298-like [Physella acuta]XP_059171441.1 cilia- and flagella-associated protein 298-like [Physella acuta]XP_059171443.1 cilia- and flagella-associated protein 298-like [Physella acuta]
MVKIHIKRGDESQFLYEATLDTPMADILKDCAIIFNGRLKVDRICGEMEELAKHGVSLPPNMQGLTDEQIEELKLKDEWGEKCQPSGGVKVNKDKIGCRNGQAPTPKMAEVLTKTIKEAKDMISKKKVEADVLVTQKTIQDALDILRGAVMIVYPMGLPPYEPIKCEFENTEDLSGKQASLEVIDIDQASLWWAGKELLSHKKLGDFVGKNEKTKIVAKIQKKGHGAPAREPVVSAEEQKHMMAYYYKKQEEMKKLEQADDDSYLDATWADKNELKRQFQGLKDIKWGPR